MEMGNGSGLICLRDFLLSEYRNLTQEQHYPSVVFPGDVYSGKHVRGYDAKQLFDANVQSHHIVVCGNIPAGDVVYKQFYEVLPISKVHIIILKLVSFITDTRNPVLVGAIWCVSPRSHQIRSIISFIERQNQGHRYSSVSFTVFQ